MSYSPFAQGITASGQSLAGKFMATTAEGNFEFQDNDKLSFGTDGDASIYSDNSSLLIANEANYPVTIGHADSTVTIPGDLTVTGTTTTVDTVTMNAANAIVFEGATANDEETTLTIVDPTADHTQYLINQGGYIPLLAAITTTAITSTPEELNILDGVTSDAGELNILDGVTATATELNYLDITTLGTAENSKAFTRKGDGTATFAGTTIANLGTVTTADINGGTWQGTVDGAWTAAGVTCANLGTVSAATSITSTAFVGPIDGIVGGNTPAAGTFTTLDCTDGAFALANLDIDGGTDIGEAIADADLFIIDNGAGGTNRKCTASRLKTYVGVGSTTDSTFSNLDTVDNDYNFVSAAAGSITVKVPENSTAGTKYTIKKTDASANTVTVSQTTADTIDGAASKILYFQYESVTVVSDGANWHII